MTTNMIFEEAKKTDLVSLLASLGFTPVRINKQDYWYLSPFRTEHTASFKVNRQRNIFYDHGEGKGGNVIDFAARYFGCDVKEAANKLQGLHITPGFSFHQPKPSADAAGEKKENIEARIILLDVRPLQSNELLHYLNQRHIPADTAHKFCKEVDFILYGKQYTAIGFENKSGGFELRSGTFKGSSSPKDITMLNGGTENICVFEGFFDFLSYATIRQQINTPLPNCLVLNSLAFFERSRALMEQHPTIHLYLDRDAAGQKCANLAIKGNDQYKDCSDLYEGYNDLNEWLVKCKSKTPDLFLDQSRLKISKEKTLKEQTDLTKKRGLRL